MTALTIQEVSRRSGLSEPTLRYYKEVGLVGPVDRDTRSGHRRYYDADLDVRDVADLHIRAMAAPAAAGKRFICASDHPTISYLELAGHPAAAVRFAGRPGAHRGSTGGRPAPAGDP